MRRGESITSNEGEISDNAEHVRENVLQILNLIKEKEMKIVSENLIECISKIVEKLEDSKLEDSKLAQIEPYITILSQKLKINRNEAILLSLLVENSADERIRVKDLCDMVGCKYVKLLVMLNDLDKLEEKGYICRNYVRRYNSSEPVSYYVPKEVIESIKQNKAYKAAPLTNLKAEELFDRINEQLTRNKDYEKLLCVIEKIIDKNQQLSYCKNVKALNLSEAELLLMTIFCEKMVNERQKEYDDDDWEEYFTDRHIFHMLKAALDNEEDDLHLNKLIETLPEEMFSGPRMRLTKKAISLLLPDYNIKITSAKTVNIDLTPYTKFKSKQLFYNDTEKKSIAELTNLLSDKQFKQVQKRLSENGMRKGFACLFYGAPGTGKTETVNQLAIATKRDVMVIDVSQIKDKYVGESEKKIKDAFDRYRQYVKDQKRAPILLFNEADAILGIRKQGSVNAVDKMENSIQNIILQEMENLDGIMIATTNLTENLDSAFERRFIYKIEFKKPSVEIKELIWKSMIPNVSDKIVNKLAKGYDFSGGQIENVARKRTVNYVLSGEEPSEEQYINYCDREQLNANKERKRVGF